MFKEEGYAGEIIKRNLVSCSDTACDKCSAENESPCTISPIHSKQFCLETEGHSQKNRKRKLWDIYPVGNSIRSRVVLR